MKNLLLILSFCTICLVACNNKQSENNGPDAMAAHIDSTVNPGDDFFQYANGKWFKQNPIPASEQDNGLWQMILDTINAQVKTICVSSAALTNAAKGSNKQKIGDFYYSAMDSATLNKNGINDLKADLEKIDGIKDPKDLFKMAAYIHSVSSSPLFGIGVGQDDKISNKHAIFISQGGLSLPDRDYYFDKDERAKNVRDKFVAFATHLYQIMGMNETEAKLAATHLVALETSMAKVSRKKEDTRDPLKNYNKISFKQLTEMSPNMEWQLFMDESGLKNVDTVIVGQPEFLSAMNGFIKTVPMADWKNYLKFHLVSRLSAYMDDKTYMEQFAFYSTALRGIKEPQPRWKRAVRQTNSALGELIGQVYVDEYLPKGTKEKLMEIGTAIKDEYAIRIKNLDWMSEATKQKALKKLNTIVMKVGYPDEWKDLSAMQIDRNSYVKNVMAANKWSNDYDNAKFGKPVNRKEWNMYPQTYNAYYNPSNNEIVVPGCNIIVPGYERKMADDAILYSIIGGSTFGHEITHGFDDQGCKYDEYGNLNNWWTAEDSTKFVAKTKMIVKQFNNYVAVDSLHINGELTQGENIADLGGIVMGYEVFKKTKQYTGKEMIAGLNPDQRFFLGYALAWMINSRPEAIANQVKSDPHSPAKFRVIGPLSNMPEFYSTFGIKEGQPMFTPEAERVRIW